MLQPFSSSMFDEPSLDAHRELYNQEMPTGRKERWLMFLKFSIAALPYALLYFYPSSRAFLIEQLSFFKGYALMAACLGYGLLNVFKWLLLAGSKKIENPCQNRNLIKDLARVEFRVYTSCRMNAFTVPALDHKVIYISSALYGLLHKPDQTGYNQALEAILAHEAGHHFNNKWLFNLTISILFLMGFYIFSKGFSLIPWMDALPFDFILALFVLTRLAYNLIDLQHSRIEEKRADSVSRKLTGSPRDVAQGLRHIYNEYSSPLKKSFGSHPAYQERHALGVLKEMNDKGPLKPALVSFPFLKRAPIYTAILLTHGTIGLGVFYAYRRMDPYSLLIFSGFLAIKLATILLQPLRLIQLTRDDCVHGRDLFITHADDMYPRHTPAHMLFPKREIIKENGVSYPVTFVSSTLLSILGWGLPPELPSEHRILKPQYDLLTDDQKAVLHAYAALYSSTEDFSRSARFSLMFGEAYLGFFLIHRYALPIGVFLMAVLHFAVGVIQILHERLRHSAVMEQMCSEHPDKKVSIDELDSIIRTHRPHPLSLLIDNPFPKIPPELDSFNDFSVCCAHP